VKLNINGELTEFTAYSIAYGNDITDGIILDMPKTYVYLSDHIKEARDIQQELPDNIEHFDLTGCDIDWTQAPHCWVMNTIKRAIVKTAELVCMEAANGDT